MKKISYKMTYIGRDLAISNLLTHLNMANTLFVYNLITSSPIDIAIFFLSSKLGLSKVAVLLILAFL
jgi:hypothetical protein